MKKYKFFEYVLTEYTNSQPYLQMLGEVEAESQEKAYELGKQLFPNSTIHRMDDGTNVYEMRGISVKSAEML